MQTQAQLTRCAAAIALACSAFAAAAPAAAADFSLSGQIRFHNDVVLIDFSVSEAASNVRLWTDSWQSGLNFDPAMALWSAVDGDFSLQAEVDDDDTIGTGQGFFDTGLLLPTLAAGNYRVTLVAAFNAANGTLLSQGFSYGNETPILLTEWNQPSYDPNANDQKGGFWRLNLSGVSQASVVPEPAAWQLLGLGLALVLGTRLHSGARRDSRYGPEGTTRPVHLHRPEWASAPALQPAAKSRRLTDRSSCRATRGKGAVRCSTTCGAPSAC